jgi:hypothetical protein
VQHRLKDWGTRASAFRTPILIIYRDSCGLVPSHADSVLLPRRRVHHARSAAVARACVRECRVRTVITWPGAKPHDGHVRRFVLHYRFGDAQNDELPFAPEVAYWGRSISTAAASSTPSCI